MTNFEKLQINSRNLNLAIYGAMGVGTATFGASAVNADIVYTDLTGMEQVVSLGNDVVMDIDGDGVDDFRFQAYSSTSSANIGAFIDDQNFVSANGVLRGISVDVLQLAFGADISGQEEFDPLTGEELNFEAGIFAYGYSTSSTSSAVGDWLNGETGYFGIRFVDGTGTDRFGWVEATFDGSPLATDIANATFTISGFAYAINESISAGQTVTAVPEPTALGLLALGGVGLMSRRKRRNAG